ncbi:MAG: carbohydrate kinase family protein [Myxococcota bacterium]|nr:carbohydrate kinase family protein [Myxococcales bacterium]
MSILVSGSVAYDHIMVFEDRFKHHILPDKVHVLNVSFVVPTLDKRWGGTAANIAYNLRIVGEDPIVLATAGRDFDPYLEHMRACGLRTDGVLVLGDAMTAQAFITTDLDDNQITAFHPGAMTRAHEAKISSVADAGRVRVGIVAPNGKQAMQEHAAALKSAGTTCVVDPGQALPLFDGDELLALLDGASVYVVNDYEWALTLEKTGESAEAIAERVGAVVITRGGEGSELRRGGRTDAAVSLASERCVVPAVKALAIVDPTGCGDSYRAGLLHALHRGLPLETGARIGSLFGALKIARPGPQSIPLDAAAFRERYVREYGEGF